MKPGITADHARSIGSSREFFREINPAGPLPLLLFALASALHAGGGADAPGPSTAPEPAAADHEGASTGAYNPLTSPLPGRTGKPLEEWGIDNGDTIISHTFSVFSDPLYPPDFPHFDYVNPDAPRGGTLRLAALGTFDSFNMYARRGTSHSFTGRFHDTLMVPSDDEIDTFYPLIAEKIEYAKDFSYVIFHIDPRARFQDGEPITAEDVIFSFNELVQEGLPQVAEYYADVIRAEAVDPLRARFDFTGPRRDMTAELARLIVLPPQVWRERDFGEPLGDVPPGSGAWTVSEFEMGKYILFERIDNYWAAELPVRKGMENFRYCRVDFFRDETALMEVFKTGGFDFRIEENVKNWVTGYRGPLFDSGVIVKEPVQTEISGRSEVFVFNTSRDIFRDRRVRLALAHALDFEWMNTSFFYSQYIRNRSYFQNTQYEAAGPPSPEELIILEPLRSQIPPEVFTEIYQPVRTDGSGSIRGEIPRALALFEEAGWSLTDGVLRNRKTGEPFEFEFMIRRASTEQIAVPLIENLKKMGITMNLVTVDSAQWYERMLSGDYDFLLRGMPTWRYLDPILEVWWHSDFKESNWNSSRAYSPEMDYLIEGIMANQNDKAALVHWGRALDRLIQWRNYFIFTWRSESHSIAHIDIFGKPNVWPKYAWAPEAWRYWWMDEEKLAALPQGIR